MTSTTSKKLRTISLVIAVLMTLIILTPCIAGPSASALSDTNYSLDSTGAYANIDSKYNIYYYVFVHDPSDPGMNWHYENVIGPNSCVEGYLYVKNMQTGEIFLAMDSPVDTYFETENEIFCVVDGTTIAEIGKTPNSEPHTIVESDSIITQVVKRDNLIYFVDGNGINSYNVGDGVTELLFESQEISTMYPVNDNTLHWTNDDGTDFAFDVRTGQSVELVDEYAVNELYADAGNTDTVTRAIDVSSLYAMSNSDLTGVTNNISLPLAEWPVGSYYTTTGRACSSHNSCMSYGGGSQCVAFAKKVYDVYSHRSSWKEVSGDLREKIYADITSLSKARVVLSILPVGSYVRFGQTTSGDGVHSAVLMNVSLTGADLYECNMDNKCGVGTRSISYANFGNYYDYVVTVRAHNYSETPSLYNIDYHIYRCTSSGCTGYILEGHSGQTCDICS